MTRAVFLAAWLLAALGCGAPQRVAGARAALSRAASNPAPPGAVPPLYLEVWARTHGSATGPLARDMLLRTGDRIGLSARTSCRAHVLLMHCDRDAVLSVFPVQGAVPFAADRRMQLPAAGMDLRLGPAVGRELLYVLASRAPLEQADPRLYAALAQAAGSTAACGPAFEALLAGAGAAPAPAPRAAVRGIDVSDTARGVARAFAEADGIVVLGFAFEHAAP